MQEEQHRAIANTGKLGAKAPLEFLIAVFAHDVGLVQLPLLAEWRVGDAVVEFVVAEFVSRQRAAKLDVLRQVATWVRLERLQEHARQTDGVGFRFQFLAVWNKRGCRAIAILQRLNVLHPVGDKAAGPDRRVIERANDAGVVDEHLVIRFEQELNAQVDNVARCHEILGRFVHFGPEAADKVFIDVRHGPLGNRVGVQVDGGEVLANLVENALFVHLADRVDEIELLEDHAGISGKLRDVIFEVLAGAARSQRFKAVARGVVERVAGCLTQDDIDIEAVFDSHFVHFGGVSPSRLKDAFQTAEKRKGQDYFAEIDVFEVTPKVIRIFPDEICE